MTTTNLLCRLAAASAALMLAIASHTARADDIDIYSNPAIDGLVPNVLFIIDNTANWGATITTPVCNAAGANVKNSSPDREEGTKMGAEKCAIWKLINSMSVTDLGQYNMAFMLFNESPDSSGYPRLAFIRVQSGADKQLILDMIAGLKINTDKGNNASTAETFYEAWLWFNSSSVRLGNKTATKNDPTAFSDASKTRYRGPGVGCAKNHIIYLANGAPGDNNNVTEALLKSINPSAVRISIPTAEGVGNNDAANWAD